MIFGWCAGPEGSAADHDSCRIEVGTTSGGISACGCPCHQEDE